MNGILRLKTKCSNGITYADDVFFTPPFKLYSPFYSGNTAEFIYMTASAGVLSGDRHELDFDIGENCRVRITDQGYQKLFNTEKSSSSQKLRITVGENASLIYRPNPVMTFRGCRHTSYSVIDICQNSDLIYSDIYCCGRTALGEEFALSEFRSRTEIRINGIPDFLDNTLICPDTLPVRKLGFFGKYTHCGFMYIHSVSKADFCLADTQSELSVSETEQGIIIRALSDSARKIEDDFSMAEKMICLYQQK